VSKGIYSTSTEVYNFCLLSKAVSEPHLKPHLMYMRVLEGQKCLPGIELSSGRLITSYTVI
jgi:hypothetical protein